MTITSRQLQKSKTLSAAEVAKRAIAQSGLDPSQMSKWAEINIIRLLNGRPSRAAERVAWLIEACQQVIRLHESMKLSDAPPSAAPGRSYDALISDVGKILKELNARLSKYKCLPVVRFCGSPDGCFDVQYLFLAPSNDAAPECVAVSFVMDYIHAVHRIRRCRRLECRKWFFAVTDHQKYCSDHCRKTDAQQGPEFKRKRAEYMRRYRPDQKERDAKTDAQAMIGSATTKRKRGRQGNAKG